MIIRGAKADEATSERRQKHEFLLSRLARELDSYILTINCSYFTLTEAFVRNCIPDMKVLQNQLPDSFNLFIIGPGLVIGIL